VVAQGYRLFNCARCHRQVKICRSCDRGNIYCGKDCAREQRRVSLRRAGRGYQATFRGRLNHAARQMTYRVRRARKVTHHAFPLLSGRPKVRLARARPAEWAAGHREREGRDGLYGEPEAVVQCDFCGCRCTPWARQGPQWG